jgi:putative hydrolase of the HAD superfamily
MDRLLQKHQLFREESVMIGNDMESDIMMAAACGVSGIHVNTDQYSEEDLHSGLSKAGEQAAGTGAVFSSVDHLHEIL